MLEEILVTHLLCAKALWQEDVQPWLLTLSCIRYSDSLVYNKQNHLYAMNFARKEQAKQLIVVEGYMDAIAIAGESTLLSRSRGEKELK